MCEVLHQTGCLGGHGFPVAAVAGAGPAQEPAQELCTRLGGHGCPIADAQELLCRRQPTSPHPQPPPSPGHHLAMLPRSHPHAAVQCCCRCRALMRQCVRSWPCTQGYQACNMKLTRIWHVVSHPQPTVHTARDGDVAPMQLTRTALSCWVLHACFKPCIPTPAQRSQPLHSAGADLCASFCDPPGQS
jgi:hypothetical protein